MANEIKACCGGFIVGDGLKMEGKVLSAEGGGGSKDVLLLTISGSLDNYAFDAIYDKEWNLITESEEEIQEYLEEHLFDDAYSGVLVPIINYSGTVLRLVQETNSGLRFSAIDYGKATLTGFTTKVIKGKLAIEYSCEIYYDDTDDTYKPIVSQIPISWRIPLQYVTSDHYTVSDVKKDDIATFVQKGGIVTFYYTSAVYTVTDVRNAIIGSAVTPKSGGGFEMQAMRMANDTDVYITTLQF